MLQRQVSNALLRVYNSLTFSLSLSLSFAIFLLSSVSSLLLVYLTRQKVYVNVQHSSSLPKRSEPFFCIYASTNLFGWFPIHSRIVIRFAYKHKYACNFVLIFFIHSLSINDTKVASKSASL